MSELPHGWTTAPLALLLAEGPTNGYSPASTPGAAGAPTLRLSATTSGYLILNEDTTKRLGEKIPPDSKLWLMPGDVLVQRANTLEYVGTAALYDGPSQTYVYPDLMMRLRPNSAVLDGRYLWRFLNSTETRAYLRERATGTASTMPKINASTLRGLPVLVPPFAEQRRIVTKLEDLLRRGRQARGALAAIAELEAKAVAWWTAANAWPERSLNGCLVRRTELAGENPDAFPIVGLSNEGAIVERRERLGAKSAHKCPVVHHGDVVFNPIRVSIGSISRYYGPTPAIVSPEYVVFTTKGISAELLVRFLRSARGRSFLESESTGSVRYRVYFKELVNLRLPLAPQDEQARAEAFFLTVRKVVANAVAIGKAL